MEIARRERVLWLDTARGMAIVLVVLHHAVHFAASLAELPGLWDVVGRGLRTLRMPLFFLVSGILASSYVTRHWGDLWNRRVLVWMWTYSVWSVITFAAFSVMPYRGLPPDPAGSPWHLVTFLVWPSSSLWYLYALAVFLIVLRAARRVPPPLVLGVAAAMSVAFGADLATLGNFTLESMGRFFVFFVLGAYGHQHLSRITRQTAAGMSGWLVLACGALAAAAAVVARSTGRSIDAVGDLPFALPVVSLVVTATGVAFSALISDLRLARPLNYLGRQTLPLYVLHLLLIGGVVTAIRPIREDLPGAVVPALPALLTAVAVAGALGLHRLSANVAGLYAPPAALARTRSEPVVAARPRPDDSR